MKQILLLIMLGWLVTGCGTGEDSEDVNQDRIYTDYELFYNSNDDVTHAIARFRFGGPFGTILELTSSSGAKVSFNGDNLAYSTLWGGHHREYAGNITSGSFRYTNTEGRIFVNSVPGGTTIAFPSGFDGSALSKSTAQALAWDGSALAPNDQVGIFIGTWTWGDDALFWTDADGATEIVMGVNALQNLSLGSAVVFLDRWNAVDVSQGTAVGGRIRYKYRAPNATITVED
jgi:hypothetical protein